MEDETLTQVKEMKPDRGMGAYPEIGRRNGVLDLFMDERVLERCRVKFGDTLVPGDPDVTAKQNRNSKTVTPYFEVEANAEQQSSQM